MQTRLFKILSTSTAFAAAAVASVNAQTFDTGGPLTTTLNTGNATTATIINISGSYIISTTGAGPAITVSGTGAATAPVININSGSIVRSDNVGGVITTPRTGVITGTTINNSGSIINLGTNGVAISQSQNITAAASFLTVNNGGTISGSIQTATATVVVNNSGSIVGAINTGSTTTYVGSGASSTLVGDITTQNNTNVADLIDLQSGAVITGNVSASDGINNFSVSGTNARINGNIWGGTGVDTVTINNGGFVSGNIVITDGANIVSATNGTVSGSITATAGADTLSLRNGSVVQGAVDLGAGANVVAISDSSIRVNTGAALTFAGGADSLYVSNSSISGTIDFGAGTDTLFTDGNYTTGGAITALDGLQVRAGTTNINHFLGSSMAAITTSASSVLNLGQGTTITGALTNNGTVNITSGTLTAATLSANAGSSLGFTLMSAVSNSQLALGTASSLAGTSLSVSVASNSGFIANGTTFTLIDGTGGTAALPTTFLNSQTGVYRMTLALADTNRDVRLTVNRIATSDVVNSEAGKSIASALDTLGTGATGTLATVQSLIGSAPTAARVNEIVESLTPSLDGAAVASVGVTNATGNQVSNRLASLRNSSGIATGSNMANNHMWVEGFGNRSTQDDKDGTKGYKANGGGATFGADTDTLLDGYTVGASFSYGQSSVDSKASSNATTDIKSYVGSLYGSRVFDQGVFVNGLVGYGLNKYESERTVIGVGQASGDFDGNQATVKVEAGKDYAMDALTLTPMASAQYTHLSLDSYTETGAGGANLNVDADSMSTLDLGLGAQVAYAMPLSNGGTFKPSAHAKLNYRAGDTQLSSTNSFTGGGASFVTNGIKADRTGVNLGAGLLLSTAAGADFSLNYDADIRNSLTGHTGQLKARWAF